MKTSKQNKGSLDKFVYYEMETTNQILTGVDKEKWKAIQVVQYREKKLTVTVSLFVFFC